MTWGPKNPTMLYDIVLIRFSKLISKMNSGSTSSNFIWFDKVQEVKKRYYLIIGY
jgi:hypothetical protein